MIDAQSVERFQRDGAICIRRLFRPADMQILRRGIDVNLANLSKRAKVASAAGDPGRFVEDFCNWRNNEDYRRFIFDTPLAETAGRLMRSSTVRLYHDHMLTKEPGMPPAASRALTAVACFRYDFSAMTSRTRRAAGRLRRSSPA